MFGSNSIQFTSVALILIYVAAVLSAITIVLLRQSKRPDAKCKPPGRPPESKRSQK